MKLVTLLVLTPLLALSACSGAQAPDTSATPPARANEPTPLTRTCIDEFVDARQFAAISRQIARTSEAPLELQAAALTETLDATLGREKTLRLLRSGLLTGWLTAAARPLPVLDPSNLCNTLSGEEK
jgi:hypothetical protein